MEEKNMSDQRKILHDDRNGLDYVLVEDYYLPMIDLPKETRPIGYWGMLRKEYIKNYKSGMYSYLLLTGKLDSYLADLNENAQIFHLRGGIDYSRLNFKHKAMIETYNQKVNFVDFEILNRLTDCI